MAREIVIFDGIKWLMAEGVYRQIVMPTPLCPKHNVPLTSLSQYGFDLKCSEHGEIFQIPRLLSTEQKLVIDKLNAKTYSAIKPLNLDEALIPIVKDPKQYTESKGHFIRTQLMQSEKGKQQVVIYTGSCDEKTKAQIFIDPETKRLSFDQNDNHPVDVFAKIEVTFRDGTKSIIEKE